MHVLYFHQHFSTPAGSTGTRSYEMARKLIERGHRVTMVCGSGKMAKSGLTGASHNGFRRGLVDGIDVIELDIPYSNYDGLLKRSWLFFVFALRSIKLALTLNYDLLFATSTPLTAGIPGIITKFFRKKPFVFEVRDLWPELPREMGVITNPFILRGMDLLEWASYHAADRCIGLSPGIVNGIIRRNIESMNVTMIPNGCDLDLFRPQPGAILDIPGVNREDFVAIFTGAHGLANGLHSVLDTASVLQKRGERDIKLVFIGDGKLKPELTKRAADEGLDNCVFIDPLPKKRLTEVLAAADVGMMILANVPAFYYGTSPNKFFDYIAAGLPVLNNYPGWLADLISGNECGIAVQPDDPNAFADALLMMRDNPMLVAEWGNNARKLAETQFNRVDLADKFVTCLENRL